MCRPLRSGLAENAANSRILRVGRRLAALEMEPLFPVWGRDTAELARDNRHPVFAHYDAMRDEPQGATDEERDILAILKSYQHPDHDTDHWETGEGDD